MIEALLLADSAPPFFSAACCDNDDQISCVESINERDAAVLELEGVTIRTSVAFVDGGSGLGWALTTDWREVDECESGTTMRIVDSPMAGGLLIAAVKTAGTT